MLYNFNYGYHYRRRSSLVITTLAWRCAEMEIFEMDKTESVNLKDHHFDLLWICCTTDCTTNSNKSVLSSIIGCQHDATRIAAERGHLKPSIGRRYAAPAAVDRCMQPTPALCSKLAARRCGCRSTGQRDGRTDTRPLRRRCSAYNVRSVNNESEH